MTTREPHVPRLLALVALAAPLATTGCVAFYKGARRWADVSQLPQVAAQAAFDKPVYVTFDYRYYNNGRPAVPLDHADVKGLNDKLVGVLGQLRSVEVTQVCPASPDFWRLHVSLKTDERYSPWSLQATTHLFALFPTFTRIAFKCRAELRDERNRRIGSYALQDDFHAVIHLLAAFCAPFNRNYPALITQNLFEQLTMAVAADLKKRTESPGDGAAPDKEEEREPPRGRSRP